MARADLPGEIDLSLVIPCYQEEPHFLDSVAKLDRVLALSRWTYEIVFVDDGSKDRTRELIQQVCREHPDRLRYVFHERNRGRGAAFKTGYRQARGRIAGFIDIDLEVGAHYVPPLAQLIDDGQADVATGFRHYLLKQTGAWLRHFLSVGYRAGCSALIGTEIQDSETGIKFFARERCAPIVLGSRNDGWFWDTEVMTRAALRDYRVVEMPVLFLRRHDKQSTVRLSKDIPEYLRALIAFRPQVGLGLLDRSPIYWTGLGYDAVMRLLQGARRARELAAVAALVDPGSSVVDVCCGTARLLRDGLKGRAPGYLGLDSNGHFILSLRKRGVRCMLFDLAEETEIPSADTVVMCSSFYHFSDRADETLAKLRRAARQRVIISEPVRNLSQSSFKPFARFANWLTRSGPGSAHEHRYTLETFRAFAERNGASRVVYQEGGYNAIAVFEGRG